ncbi:hypothetical protein AURDEDRAFT_170459 [Auricularia subglabra TFB-10046 SS5]|nr:hypothetical protein AURDEDRAFT_170459 [Auricularia subglabra TFB-10046 SS5]
MLDEVEGACFTSSVNPPVLQPALADPIPSHRMDGYADEKRNSSVITIGMGMLMGNMSDDDNNNEKIALPPQT